MKNYTLPEGFIEEEWNPWPTRRKGIEILYSYCVRCTKRPDCDMNTNLRHAMGEDYPYWSESFKDIGVPEEDFPFLSTTSTFCEEYSNPQLILPGMPKGNPDGIELLLKLIKKEEIKLN